MSGARIFRKEGKMAGRDPQAGFLEGGKGIKNVQELIRAISSADMAWALEPFIRVSMASGISSCFVCIQVPAVPLILSVISGNSITESIGKSQYRNRGILYCLTGGRLRMICSGGVYLDPEYVKRFQHYSELPVFS